MIRGFYTALSGVVAAMTRQDVVADNIANANTVGFKQSQTSQTDYEMSIMNSLGPELGLLGTGTIPTGLKLDISQGPLQQTGNGDATWPSKAMGSSSSEPATASPTLGPATS